MLVSNLKVTATTYSDGLQLDQKIGHIMTTASPEQFAETFYSVLVIDGKNATVQGNEVRVTNELDNETTYYVYTHDSDI